MNTKEAISHLAKVGIKVVAQPNGTFHIGDQGGELHMNYSYTRRYERIVNPNWTAREMIKFAKCYSSENKQHTAIKKNVKHFSNAKDRSSTRDLLKTENYDGIPQNRRTKQDDIWSWD